MGWTEKLRAEAQRRLEATHEGRKLLGEARAVLERQQESGGRSAWQKAFAESQAVLNAQLAEARQRGLILLPLAEALVKYPDLVQTYWPRLTDEMGCLLTLALWRHGTFIYVPKGLSVDTLLSPWPATDFPGESFSLTIVALAKGAKASVLSGCVQAKPDLGALRAASWSVHVGEEASLEWVTLENFKGTADAGWRSWQVAADAAMTWRFLRLADGGTLCPMMGEGPLRWEGVIVPGAKEGIFSAQLSHGDALGEVLVFQNPAARYHVRSLGAGSIPWRGTVERTMLVKALRAFPMEYAIEAEMALDRLIAKSGESGGLA